MKVRKYKVYCPVDRIHATLTESEVTEFHQKHPRMIINGSIEVEEETEVQRNERLDYVFGQYSGIYASGVSNTGDSGQLRFSSKPYPQSRGGISG